MRPKRRPVLSMPSFDDHSHFYIYIDPREVFTTRTLYRDLQRLRQHLAGDSSIDSVLTKSELAVVGGTALHFRISHYFREEQDVRRQLKAFDFDFAVDDKPEATQDILFLTAREPYGRDECLAILEPDQPVTTASFKSLFEQLGHSSKYLSFDMSRPYLALRDGDSSSMSDFRYSFSPRYKHCKLDVTCELDQGFIERIWITVTGTPGYRIDLSFDLDAARLVPNIVGVEQTAEGVARARLIGLPQGTTYTGLMTDLVTDNIVWQQSLAFARALGYHPDVTEFRVNIDSQRALSFLPGAVSARS